MEGFSQVCLLVWIVVLTGAVFGVRRVGGCFAFYIFICLYTYSFVLIVYIFT